MITDVICEPYKAGLEVADKAKLDTELIIPPFSPNYGDKNHNATQTVKLPDSSSNYNDAQYDDPSTQNGPHPLAVDLSPIRTAQDTYSIENRIGKGSQAMVYEVERSDGSLYAAKVVENLKLNKDRVDNMRSEGEILTRLDHPNIVELVDFVENDRHIALLFNIKSENLSEYNGRNFEKRRSQEYALNIVKLLAQVADALSYTHSEGIIHRDVKPDNILVADNTAFLADFGVAISLDDYLLKRDFGISGTPLYMSPEVLQSEAGPASDMWSLGVTLYQTLTGELPFSSNSRQTVFNVILEEDPMNVREKRSETRLTEPEDLPEGIEELTHNLLQKDPEKRPTARQFVSTAEDILKAYTGSLVLNS